LKHGEVAAEGGANEVVREYEKFLAVKEKPRSPIAPEAVMTSPGRILSSVVLDETGNPKRDFRPGEPWTLQVEFEGDSPERALQIHVAIVTTDQITCFVADSRLSGYGPFSGKDRYTLRLHVERLPLAKGEFFVSTFLGDEKALALFDARSDTEFQVLSDHYTSGLMTVPIRWENR
jgi:hypothetical protein